MNEPHVQEYNPKNMSTWRQREIKKRGHGSQSAGKDKYGKRYPTPLQKWMAKKNRSHKHVGYHDWYVAKNGERA